MRALLVGCFFFVGLLPVIKAEAATLYMDPVKTEINRGDTITVALRLDTDEEECINSADVTVNYTENIQLIDTSRGSSIFSMWVEDPVIDKTNRTVTFAGGIPNGYCGRIIGDPRLTNTLVELVFSSPSLQIGTTESGDIASITYGEETQVLLNDGRGTNAELRTFGSEIKLAKTAGGRMVNEWADQVTADDTPPEEFTIKLERTPNAFANKYFITFNTTDKQSGIDYYEVIEEPMEEFNLFKWGRVDAPWVKSKSPYVLKDQSLNSIIRVRAYDKAGNEYIDTLIPDESVRTVSDSSKIMIALVASALVLFVLAAVISFIFWRRRSGRVYEEEEEIDELE